MKYLVFSSLLFILACKKSDIETAEVRDENGNLTERFERRRKDFAKHGLYQRFNAAGKIVEEARFENDTLQGEHKFFYASGTLEILEPNVNGKIHGKYKKYFENGSLALEQDYVNGVLEGQSTAWYPNGQKKEVVTFKGNEENGLFKEWHENGNLKAEGSYFTPDDPDFVGDKEHGELKLYDSTGVLERVMMCDLGVCRTTWEKK